jgi:C-terminal processing protease CtpA/Prc
MEDRGARVSRIILESPAGRTGDIHPGDDIVSVNGKRTWHMEHKVGVDGPEPLLALSHLFYD